MEEKTVIILNRNLGTRVDLRRLERNLGTKVEVPLDHEYVCALGAALLGLKTLASSDVEKEFRTRQRTS